MRPLNEIRHYMGNYQVKSGVYHYYRGEFTQALQFLRRALRDEDSLDEDDRRNAGCYLALSLKSLGQRLASEGDLDGGLAELRQAAEVRPDFPDIHYLTGQLEERLGRYPEAIAAYRRALEHNDTFAAAWVSLAGCLAREGARDEAGEAYRKALDLKVRDLQEPFDQGLALLDAGRVDEARRSMIEVFRANPSLAEAHLENALERLRAEDYEPALVELDRALALSPRYPDLHNFRGIALCGLDRPADAAESFREAARLSPGQIVPRLNLAFSQLRAGQEDQAVIELESVLAHQPDEPVAAAKLAELRGRGPGARSTGSAAGARRSVGGAR